VKKSVIKLFRRLKAFYYLKTRQFGNTKIQAVSTQKKAVDANIVKKAPAFTVYLLERRINCMTIPTIVEAVQKACIERRKITVANTNVHSFNLSMQFPWFYDFLQSSEIVHCDSVGILKAISYMGLNLPLDYRASYTLLMPKILENCNQNRFSVFLLGAKPQNLQAALEKLRVSYPNVSFAGHHGYFDQEDPKANQAVIQQINQVKPNILLMGMGMPVQESWVKKHRSNLQVNAILLGGAIINRLAGVVPDCPSFVSNIGLEWLYRLCREPKRLAARYLLGNPAFVLHIFLGKFYANYLRVEPMQSKDNANLEGSVDYDFSVASSKYYKKAVPVASPSGEA
jgi:N-acetylglucosaminyldiphosphoundecaprenol N-acetyl-beta-D-mannosaminyltransferase